MSFGCLILIGGLNVVVVRGDNLNVCLCSKLFLSNAGHADVIEILIKNGAHVDAGIDEGITPLRMAARWGN